jgi:hypothetical protein
MTACPAREKSACGGGKGAVVGCSLAYLLGRASLAAATVAMAVRACVRQVLTSAGRWIALARGHAKAAPRAGRWRFPRSPVAKTRPRDPRDPALESWPAPPTDAREGATKTRRGPLPKRAERASGWRGGAAVPSGGRARTRAVRPSLGRLGQHANQLVCGRARGEKTFGHVDGGDATGQG